MYNMPSPVLEEPLPPTLTPQYVFRKANSSLQGSETPWQVDIL